MSAAFETSPLHFEKEAINARRRLSSNLDELADNLTAGRMLDEVLGYARGGGASFLKGLGNAASENPIPTLLVGVGAAMFLSGKGRVAQRNGSNGHGNGAERATSTVRNGAAALGEAASHAGSGAVRGAQSAGAAVAEATGHLRDTAASAASGAAGKVREAADAVGSRVADTAAAVGNAAGHYAKAATETLTTQTEHLAEETANLAHDLSARIAQMAREQPLMVAAAGLAIGAAIAALLPRTDFEDSLMGETSEAVKESVSEAAAETYEKTKEAASHVVEEITDAAKEEGLTAGAAASAARGLGDKAARVVQAGKEAAEDEVGHMGKASVAADTSRQDQT